MHIALEPAELGFRRPFTQEVTQSLAIRNIHYEPVAFKVKTTAPKQYCVRPNSGRIEAGQSVTVKVMLQAMKEDPPPDIKCRDKFLVQTVAITADKESQSATEIWAYVDKNDKPSIQEKKIRVVFLPEQGAVNGLAPETSSRPPSYQESSSASHPAPVSNSESKAEDYTSKAEIVLHPTTPATSPSNSDLSAQLAEARQQIVKLRKQLADVEKNSALGHDEKLARGGQLATQFGMQTAPDGVPVKVVAALCLVSFFIALLF